MGAARAAALVGLARTALPRGAALPRATWDRRHRWLVRLLAAGTVTAAVAVGCVTAPAWATPEGRAAWGGAETLVAVVLLGALALLGTLGVVAAARWSALPRRRADQLRASCATTGVMGCALLAVVISGGAAEAHLLLYVAAPLIALHESWTPYLAALGAGLAAQVGAALVPLVHVTGTTPHLHLGGHVLGGTLGGAIGRAHDAAPGASEMAGGLAGTALHAGLLGLACLGALVAWRASEAARGAAAERVAELEHRTRHDALTGLLNRRGAAPALDAALRSTTAPVVGQVDDAVGETVPTTRPVAVVLLDLDRFKDVNDTLGHATGDELLRRVADVLRRCCDATQLAIPPTVRRTTRRSSRRTTRATAGPPEGDRVVAARLGGDEFVVVVPGGRAADAAALAELVAGELRAGVPVAGRTTSQGVSCGVAEHEGGWPLDGEGRTALAEELLRRADVALRAAKAGDDDVVVHDPAMDEQARRRSGLLRDLRLALDRDDQLLLHYQPQVCLVGPDAGTVVGVEAFVRWQHPALGLLTPGDFLDAAADGGLEHRLTAEVLRLALVQAGRWADAGRAVPVAVNASRHSLVRPGFAALVARSLGEHRVPAHLLRIEITEDDLVQDPEVAVVVVTELRAMGVGTAVDDFGTGYSSLAHLRRLPVEEVKLDRSFVTGLGQRPPAARGPGGADEVLVESVIGLAHRLGVRVVAEGVERLEEAVVLRRLGCDAVQGRLVAPPAAPGALPPLVVERRVSRREDARSHERASSTPGPCR